MAQIKRTSSASASASASASRGSTNTTTTSRLLPLAGKVAVVTNAAQRPVWDIALELARRGANIVATYDSPKDKPFINALVSKIASLTPPPHSKKITTTTTSPRCLPLLVDLGSPSAASLLVIQTVARFGPRVDIIVNTPYEATSPSQPLLQSINIHNPNDSDFDSDFDSDDDSDDDSDKKTPASLNIPELFKPLLPQSGGGRIITITSAGARYNDSSSSPDALVSELSGASKETLDQMTRTWAEELRCGGHTANVVDLGAEYGEVMDGVPLEDTVRLVTWLASAESGGVTGRMLSPT